MGKMYKAKNIGYQMIIRDEVYDPHIVPGRPPRVIKPVLTVDFGDFGAATPYESGGLPEFGAGQYMVADIRGGFIDLDSLIETKKSQRQWDEDDIEAVRYELEQAVTNPQSPFYGDIEEYVHKAPDAPWPSYDEMPPQRIAVFAVDAGLVQEALHYEGQTQARPEVLAALRGAADRAEALTAVAAE